MENIRRPFEFIRAHRGFKEVVFQGVVFQWGLCSRGVVFQGVCVPGWLCSWVLVFQKVAFQVIVFQGAVFQGVVFQGGRAVSQRWLCSRGLCSRAFAFQLNPMGSLFDPAELRRFDLRHYAIYRALTTTILECSPCSPCSPRSLRIMKNYGK